MRLDRETTGIKIPNTVLYSIENKVLFNDSYTQKSDQEATGGPPHPNH
jgi:hypothetical protein